MSLFNLRIEISDENRFGTDITVFDTNNTIIASESTDNSGAKYQYAYRLPKALYTVRASVAGAIKDTVIVLDRDIYCVVANENSYYDKGKTLIKLPRVYSSVLFDKNQVNNYASSHEYYTSPVMHWCQNETVTDHIAGTSNDQSLFIFLRFPSRENYANLGKRAHTFFKSYSILDKDGKTVYDFKNEGVIQSKLDEDGWVAFNAFLPLGLYYLSYRGTEKRLAPIYVYKYWHTQYYLTMGVKPQFATARVFFNNARNFDPRNIENQFADIFLKKLQGGDYTLNEQQVKVAAYGKYQSPVLGLLCAYIYLKSEQTKNDQLFRTIVDNLTHSIFAGNADAPDIRALNLMADAHFNRPQQVGWNEPVAGVPMFRVGYEAIKRASVSNPTLIPAYGLNDLITEKLFYDSPFITFAPISFAKLGKDDVKTISSQNLAKEPRTISNKTRSNLFDDFLSQGDVQSLDLNAHSFIPAFRSDLPEPKRSLKWLTTNDYKMPIRSIINKHQLETILNNIEHSKRGQNWLSQSIASMIKEKGNVTMNEISRQLSVSGSTVSRVFREFSKK